MADEALMQSLRDFGEVIRAGAARRAGAWSHRIPESGRVESVRDSEVLVVFGGPGVAPHARTYEVQGMRHPVWGHGPRKRGPDGHPPGWHWVESQWRPFLEPAAREDSDKATEQFAKVVDRWGFELGFTDR